MKTIDDLLAYEQNRKPDFIPKWTQKASESDDEWYQKMKRMAELDFMPTREREVTFHTSREGHTAFQEALRQASLEDKQLIWNSGRRCGKSDTISAMQMTMMANAEEKRKKK